MPTELVRNRRRRLDTYEQVIPPHVWDQRFHGLEAVERMELDLIARFSALSSRPAPRMVLDVGCGTGRLLALFPADKYIGVDRSLPFLQHCRAHRKRENADFVLADLDSLPLRPGPFDVVLAIGTLESETDPGDRVRHMLQYVRPGGRLVFTLQNRRNLPGWIGNSLTGRYRQSFWSRAQVLKVLYALGLPFELSTCYLLPPGALRTLLGKAVSGRPLRRALARLYLAAEEANGRFRLCLGYQWVISVRREAAPTHG